MESCWKYLGGTMKDNIREIIDHLDYQPEREGLQETL